MYLENIGIDAQDPQRVGRFWEALLSCSTLTDEADLFETRLTVPDGPDVPDGPVLDLCFQRVEAAPAPNPRMHLEVSGGGSAEQALVVERALALGARHLDIGQRDVPWVVLADPDGSPFCVMEDRPEYAVSGLLSSLPLDSADVARDLRFWSELSGWGPADSAVPGALRHPSGRGPLLELCPQARPKGADEKNRVHLDLRLEADDDEDEAVTRILDLGGGEYDPGWGALPWRLFRDPSGNEVCLLPAPASRP